MGIIDQLDNAGALPALDKMMRFAAGRQKLIAHNIANMDTPGFLEVDVDPKAFQEQLAKAIDDRRSRNGGGHGDLGMESTREVGVLPDGRLSFDPRTGSGNILFHDRNNRDLERTMQSMVENAAMFRLASDLYRNRTRVLRDAIAERVT
ncbi:MAG: hypothetical protein H6810_10460 [Phycisphaeraceae bacterium]|nr:MAG: hypothetical protein H6810_10460 [Phycisphaeraceae bacterium]